MNPLGLTSKIAVECVNYNLLRNYPGLTAQDLVNAWEYVGSHKEEIENQISENEAED